MRAIPLRDHDATVRDLRRAIERLDALPIRPTSARQARAGSSGPAPDDLSPASPSGKARPTSPLLVDPGWMLEQSRARSDSFDPILCLAGLPWWPGVPAGATLEAITRLWRLSAAVAIAARKLAVEADDPDPDAVARAGLLHNLGLWAVAAVDPGRLVAWFATRDAGGRRTLERRWLGVEAADLGRDLAERWGCEPLVVDATWLHADLAGELEGCAEQPGRLACVRKGFDRARRTPWSPGDETSRDPGCADPRSRVLVAEVQARCGGPWIEPDASPFEEKLTRDNARLRIENARLQADQAARDRFLKALAASSPSDSPETWADRASLAWCEEPGVAAARVAWSGVPGEAGPEDDGPASPPSRPPSAILPLGEAAGPAAEVRLWHAREGGNPAGSGPHPARGAWDAWSREIAERARLRRRLDVATSALRTRVADEGEARRVALIAALAEFAAGAGHELNNPLAVILGRAQLVLARVDDPDAARSLQAIIAQAQRAHRILRDLMYVARPPEPRLRPCQPDEIVRACVRDLQAEAEARGVRLTAEAREAGPRVWADPDPLRHLADILVRNALEATPSGGSVQFTAAGDRHGLRWTVRDNGRGIGPDEGAHLFDPFFCGRQAGRGLGLGLPRAARIVERGGGELRWQSAPGLGTSFQVSLPVLDSPPNSSLRHEESAGGSPRPPGP